MIYLPKAALPAVRKSSRQREIGPRLLPIPKLGVRP